MIRIIPFYFWSIFAIVSFIYYNRCFIGAYRHLKLRDDRFDSLPSFIRGFKKPSLIQADYAYDRGYANKHLEKECRRGLSPFFASIATLLLFPGKLFQFNLFGSSAILSIVALGSLFCVAAVWWLTIYSAMCAKPKIEVMNYKVLSLFAAGVVLSVSVNLISKYYFN